MAQLVINNFTRGKLDHDLNGRFDLPFYLTDLKSAAILYLITREILNFAPGSNMKRNRLTIPSLC